MHWAATNLANTNPQFLHCLSDSTVLLNIKIARILALKMKNLDGRYSQICQQIQVLSIPVFFIFKTEVRTLCMGGISTFNQIRFKFASIPASDGKIRFPKFHDVRNSGTWFFAPEEFWFFTFLHMRSSLRTDVFYSLVIEK